MLVLLVMLGCTNPMSLEDFVDHSAHASWYGDFAEPYLYLSLDYEVGDDLKCSKLRSEVVPRIDGVAGPPLSEGGEVGWGACGSMSSSVDGLEPSSFGDEVEIVFSDGDTELEMTFGSAPFTPRRWVLDGSTTCPGGTLTASWSSANDVIADLDTVEVELPSGALATWSATVDGPFLTVQIPTDAKVGSYALSPFNDASAPPVTCDFADCTFRVNEDQADYPFTLTSCD